MNSPARRCAVSVLILASTFFAASAVHGQVTGTNVNMVSGTKWPNGDPFLQRQNEPSMAVSTRNPLHILAGANDYRTVDLELALSGGIETGDAWLGLFKSFDGGLTWQSTLLPGCPQALFQPPVQQCLDNGALGGTYQAASDPVVRAGTNGMFYYAGLAFDRATSSSTASSRSTIFIQRFVDLNNNENVDPITYIDTHLVASGNAAQFLDKPALAVDIPRSGATTCSFVANEPGVGPNGGNLAVPQSFPGGNVYIAYTDFLKATKDNATPTHLMFSHSTDCGVTWNAPVQINVGTTTSQGAAIAVNSVNGNVYVAWRQFGSAGVPDAIMVAQSTNGGKTFHAPVRISTFQPFDQGTTFTSFRTNAYPSITTDFFGFVYVAFSARGVGNSGDARVVVAGSIDGNFWTPAIMVDNPPQGASNPSGRGHQIMPAITFANGRLTLLYYDLRLDHYAGFYTQNLADPSGYTETLFPEGELAPPNPLPNSVFNKFIDDSGLTLRRHTLDLRVLELGLFPTVVLGPSVLVSQYEYGCCVNPNSPDIEQFKFNVPNLPLFALGSEPFFGDYIDIVPSPWFVPRGNTWHYNFMPSVNPLFHATWTDNRDVVPPANGRWDEYTPVVPQGVINSIFQPGTPLNACVSGNEGMRNQNIYTAQITGGLVVGAPGNAKQLGTTNFNNQTVPFQRGFAVEAQNVTNQTINVRFTIANQPTGGSASFLQLSLLTSLDVTIPARSSVSRTVFVTSSNPQATVTVNVVQISGIGGGVVTNGLNASAVLNPDITNPNITNPNITNPNITNPNITNFEVTDPNITNPNITNPNITNPNITNPNITNPNITNPNITNPNITNTSAVNVTAPNPNITNPDITNPNITNPNITNPDITNGAVQDAIYPITNNGNTDAAYTVKVGSTQPLQGNVLQLIINRLYQTPKAISCQLTTETHWVTVANIVNPKIYSLSDPQLGNPNITNSAPTEASVTLAPGETAYIDFRIVTPPGVTPPAPGTFTPVTIPQAIDTQTVLANPGNATPPVIFPTLTIQTTTLPSTDRFDPGYSQQLVAIGGKPGAQIWSTNPTTLPPGLTLSPGGLMSGEANLPGSYTFTVKVTDAAPQPNVATQIYTVNVSATPLTQQFVTTPPFGVVGQPYNGQPLAVNGGTTPYHFTAPGLPPGLSIDPGTGFVSGTPTTPVPIGTLFTITATDSATPAMSQSYQTTIPVGSVIQVSPTTLPSGTIGSPYTFQLSASGGFPGYGFGPPNLPGGGLLSAAGVMTFPNPTLSSVSFTVNVHDSAIPFQTVTANYTINFAGPNAFVTFVRQPPTYNGDQPNPNSPVQVHVADASNAPIAGANVTLSFNGTPPCSTAALSGTLAQQTNATGDAFFTDVSVDRGQIGYKFQASVSPAVFGISNPFTVNGFCGTGNLSAARAYPASALIKGGQVLIAGGQTSAGASNVADIYDPGTGTVTGLATMITARFKHTATALNDATVLIVGGQLDNSGNPALATTAEIFNAGTGTFSNTANAPNVARTGGHTATLLADGTVLIAGGVGSQGNVLQSAEIYSPANQNFTNVGSLNHARFQHTATLLSNGQVLIAGGSDNTAELYDPVAQTFTLTGNLSTARLNPTATLLSNGQVLVAGGLTNISTAELYDPLAGIFTLTGSLNTGRGAHTATLLTDGTVLVAGGFPGLGSAEVYNPASSTFSNTGSLINSRWQDAAILLNDGTVLIAGGFGGNFLASTERYFSTSPLGPMTVTTPTTLAPGQPATSVFSNSTAFNGAVTGITPVIFNGILPTGTPFEGFNPLTVSGINFSTTNPNALVNVTTASFYSPHNYPADFIIDSTNPGPNNNVTIVLPQPTRALALDYGGFAGGTSGAFSLSNGFNLPVPGLPGVGTTQFTGFVSATPFSSLTFTTTNDSWVVLDLLLGVANTALPSATENVPYTQVLLEQGGVGLLTWTLASGSLPPGMNLSASGVITGTPTSSGTFTATVHLVDSSPTPKVVNSGSLTLTVQPQPPTNLIGSPQAPGIATLTWTPSLSGDVAGYRVHRGTSSGNYTTVINVPNTNSYVDSGLATGTYFYVVSAVSSSGVESPVSNEVSVSVQ